MSLGPAGQQVAYRQGFDHVETLAVFVNSSDPVLHWDGSAGDVVHGAQIAAAALQRGHDGCHKTLSG